MTKKSESESGNETGHVPDLLELADRLAIVDVVRMHSRGVDRASGEILMSCYWSDAEVDYGGFKGNAHEFCQILPRAIKRYARTQHKVSNTIVEFVDGRAFAESYVTAHHYEANPDGEDTEMTYIGRYLDQLHKRHNVWKIFHRKIVMDWHQHVVASHDDDNAALKPITRGAHFPDDPLFKFLDNQ